MERRPDLLAALGPHPALEALADEPHLHVVGGAVRDALLGRSPRELDFVVEGDAAAVARRAAERLGGRVAAHERFGTATVRTPDTVFDIASARRERYPRPGALPEVEFGASVEEDLARRDLTINAMALALADGTLTACPTARADLAAGVLRVLHDASFRDDPTRMLRLARYAARLGFAPDPHTDALLAADAGAVDTVTGARLGEELRLLLREPQPAALAALARHGLGAAAIHPGFDPALVPAALALVPSDARADLAALAAACRAIPGRDLTAALDRLAFPAPERRIVVAAVTAPPLAPAGDDAALWTAVRGLPPEAVAVAGAAGDAASARRWLDHVRHRRLAITGHDLLAVGLTGPAVGAGLEAAMAAHLRGEAPDRAAQLEAARRAAA